MKNYSLLFASLALFFCAYACVNNQEQEENTPDEITELNDSLHTALAEKDSLMSLFAEVTDGLLQIKDMEKLLETTNFQYETPDRKAQIKNDMLLIQRTLQQRREHISRLEAKLRKSNNYNAEMEKAIASLKLQIEQQEGTIAELRDMLASANIQIENLSLRVDSLDNEDSRINREKIAVQEENVRLTDELNTCYFVTGSKNELRRSKIIETGFLKKTKILESDYELSYFTKADKRTLNDVPLYSKKARIYSKHPAGSYELRSNENGIKTLHITNPDKFWKLSNFLIIQTD